MYYSKIVSLILLLIITTTTWFILIPTSSIDYESTQNNFKTDPQSLSQPKLKSMESSSDDVTPFSIQRIGNTNQEFEEWRYFWVPDVSSDPLVHYQVNATLRVIGPHCLIYSDLPIANETFLDMNNSFETVIYPRLEEFYGSPPDIDNNNRIIILVIDIKDGFGGGQYVAGFFYQLNEYDNSDLNPGQRYSNEAEILYIDGKEGLTHLNNGDFETIAHEFQHMIHFGHDDNEDTWLDEGASMFAEYLIGKDPFSGSNPYKSRFSSNPDVSLTYWDYYDSKNLVMANYGAAYAFYLYLSEHYGGSNTIQDLVTNSKNGIESVELVLQDLGYSVKFKEVFRNWTIANFLDDTSFANGTYGYYNTSLTMSVEYTYDDLTIPRTENSVPYWGTDYLRFLSRMGQPFVLEFQGDPTSNFMVTAILTNNTTPPVETVIPIKISSDNFGNFSIEDIGVSADEITLAISSYTPIGKHDYSNEDPAPAQDYWFMINPMGIVISAGRLSFSTKGSYLRLSNVTVSDKNGYSWQEADGAIYTVLTESGNSTGISGNLTYNSEANYWMSDSIDISSLSEDNQTYQVKYFFFNSTHSGYAFSKLFSVEISSSTQSDTKTMESTNNMPFPGFLLVLSLLTIILLTGNHRKR